jgi:hypothetical protein
MRDSADMLNYDGGMECNGMESNVIIIFVYNNYVRLLYCI